VVHRIFLVRTRADLGTVRAQEHWRGRHAGVFGRNPGLLGYVQDRPLAEDWPELEYQACSETWFDSEEAERAAFRSSYYQGVVVPDESAFLDRGSAWRGRVVRVDLVADGPREPYRVLAFGASRLPEAGRVAVLYLDREPPAGGPLQVFSAWLPDRAQARELATSSDGLAFAVEPFSVLAPPEAALA
jgi:uncharacterized protein (TIGR02118 family)